MQILWQLRRKNENANRPNKAISGHLVCTERRCDFPSRIFDLLSSIILLRVVLEPWSWQCWSEFIYSVVSLQMIDVAAANSKPIRGMM